MDRKVRQLEEEMYISGDHKYHDPDDYDWRTWQGETLRCGISNRMGEAVLTAGALARGEGPFYCPEHDEPRAGYIPRGCLECAWDGYLADDALSLARARARAWRYNQQGAAA